jgi:hypothetical protein
VPPLPRWLLIFWQRCETTDTNDHLAMGAIFVSHRRQPLDRQASIAANNSPNTHASASTDACAANADLASAEPTHPRAQAACARTNGSGSDKALESTGTASGEPQLPSPTHTFRANPALPERRIAEPRENESHATSSSAVSSSAISDGERVPGCDRETPISSCTPSGATPGARAASAGSDVACEKRIVKGQRSWELCRLTGYEIPLSCGLFRRRAR